MEGMQLNPEILIQTQQNVIGQNAVRMVQLEAAVQEMALENQRLRAMIPEDEEVKEDESSTNS